MAKTEETLALERALDEKSRKKREYGCAEVTIGFRHDGHGDEIADYMTMDSSGVFRCYEIKVSLSDLKSSSRLSWYGDYNYLVVSDALYMRSPDWDQYIPPYAGILAGTGLTVMKNARRRTLRDEDRELLKDSLLRSVYWKMIQYRDSGDLSVLREKDRKMAELQTAYESYVRKADRLVWTCGDYERYYAANHQLSSFSLEAAAKMERMQYMERRKGNMTWQETGDGAVCPVCGGHGGGWAYCPFCGADLRKLEETE